MDADVQGTLRAASELRVVVPLDPDRAARVAQLVAEFLRIEPAMTEAIENGGGVGWREEIGEGPGRKVNPWLSAVLDDFYAARQTWDDSCEEYSKGYETEAAEFAELWPKPRLADFLVQHGAARIQLANDGGGDDG